MKTLKNKNFLLLIAGGLVVILVAFTLSNDQISPEVNQTTQSGDIKQVPTKRPEEVPETWSLFVHYEAGVSFYYPKDWNVQTSNNGVTLTKAVPDYSPDSYIGNQHRKIEVYLQEMESEEDLEPSIEKWRSFAESGEEMNLEIRGKTIQVYRKSSGETMITAIFPLEIYLLRANLIEGHGIGGVSFIDKPFAQEDMRVFLNILKTLQFAE